MAPVPVVGQALSVAPPEELPELLEQLPPPEVAPELAATPEELDTPDDEGEPEVAVIPAVAPEVEPCVVVVEDDVDDDDEADEDTDDEEAEELEEEDAATLVAEIEPPLAPFVDESQPTAHDSVARSLRHKRVGAARMRATSQGRV